MPSPTHHKSIKVDKNFSWELKISWNLTLWNSLKSAAISFPCWISSSLSCLSHSIFFLQRAWRNSFAFKVPGVKNPRGSKIEVTLLLVLSLTLAYFLNSQLALRVIFYNRSGQSKYFHLFSCWLIFIIIFYRLKSIGLLNIWCSVSQVHGNTIEDFVGIIVQSFSFFNWINSSNNIVHKMQFLIVICRLAFISTKVMIYSCC